MLTGILITAGLLAAGYFAYTEYQDYRWKRRPWGDDL